MWHSKNHKKKGYLNYGSFGYNSKRGTHWPVGVSLDAIDIKIKRAVEFNVGHMGSGETQTRWADETLIFQRFSRKTRSYKCSFSDHCLAARYK